MSSLGFDLLDRHVVAGRADDPAVEGPEPLTFAGLLERAAALASALRVLGVATGDTVGVPDEPGVVRTVAICACARLAALPAAAGTVTIEADPAVVRTEGEEFGWAVALRAGGADPEPARAGDPESYREHLLTVAADVVPALLAARPVRVAPS